MESWLFWVPVGVVAGALLVFLAPWRGKAMNLERLLMEVALQLRADGFVALEVVLPGERVARVEISAGGKVTVEVVTPDDSALPVL